MLAALLVVTAVPGGAAADRAGTYAADVAPHVERLREAVDAGVHDAATAQHLYDVARDVETAAIRSIPVDCAWLLRAVRRAAADGVAAAETFDRQARTASARTLQAARRLLTRIPARPAGCATVPLRLARSSSMIVAPSSGGAFAGVIRMRAPDEAAFVRVFVDGVLARTVVARSGSALTTRLPAGPSRIGRLRAEATDAGGRVLEVDEVSLLARLRERDLTVMPAATKTVVDGPPLAAAARAFPGISGVWVARLAQGRRETWNADARFPAASTVKLGVLAVALRRFREEDERAAVLHDLAAVAGWSSNLGANRIVRLLGRGDPALGAALVEYELRRLGATGSTYPGSYRAGTARSVRSRGALEPPQISARVTTAHDLGLVLETIHRAAAAGGDDALLSRDAARVLIGLLLRSTGRGENAGLIAPFTARGIEVAQKNGWIRDARHTASILFGPRGPVVCVVLTYHPALSLATAQRLGRRIARGCSS